MNRRKSFPVAESLCKHIKQYKVVILSLQISHQLGTVMDLFTTAALLAGAELPKDRVLDGIDLSPALFKDRVTDRCVHIIIPN